MRFVWAVVSFVMAAVLIGAGIAQRTVFLGPTTEKVAVSESAITPYVVVDGAVFSRLPGAQTLVAKGQGEVFGAYASTGDTLAWLADTTYTHVTLGADGAIEQKVVKPSVEAPEPSDEQVKADTAATDAGLTVPSAASPVGSDVWVDEFSASGTLTEKFAMAEDSSLVLATDGTEPAPGNVTLTWNIDNSTPWAGPLIVLGGIALAVGILFYILGILHMRRSRGPRRRGVPDGPKGSAPSEDAEGEDKGVISTSGARRRGQRGRRAFIAVPLALSAAVAISGCSADAWPKVAQPSATPTPTQTVVAPEGQQKPQVTPEQAEKIIGRISETVAAADEAKNPDIASTRLTGAALAERITNYTLRAALPDEPALAAIPKGQYRIILPQAIEGWPRTIMAVWVDEKDATNPPQITMLVQESAWEPYKLAYLGQMEASAAIPDLPPSYIGSNRVRLDSSLLALAPDKLAAAYADLIDKGDASEYASLFDFEGDAFFAKIREGRDARLAAFNQTGAETGNFTFSSVAGETTPIGMQTLHSGAIVAVSVTEKDVVKPTTEGAVIKLPENPRVKALTGVETSSKGFETSYGDQLFFYVPGEGSGEKISLIGFASNILSAEALK